MPAAERTEPRPVPTSRRIQPVAAAAPPPAAAAAPPAAQRGDGSRRRGRLLAAAVALVLLAGVAIAVAAGGGDDGGEERAGATQPATQKKKKPKPARTQPEAVAPAPAPEPETPATPAEDDNEPETGPGPSDTGESPSALNDAGYKRLQAGDAAGAVPLLEQAVAGFDAQGGDPTTFGYALFNLGQAYAQTGRHDEAVTMFERRLQVNPSDRPEVVRAAIAESKAAQGR
jgi:tetratricopeptide (TPR) repeat protein